VSSCRGWYAARRTSYPRLHLLEYLPITVRDIRECSVKNVRTGSEQGCARPRSGSFSYLLELTEGSKFCVIQTSGS
jgi:hypothetical protein